MRLDNPAYKNWNFVLPDIKNEWIRSISIGDYATYTNRDGSIIEGRIEVS